MEIVRRNVGALPTRTHVAGGGGKDCGGLLDGCGWLLSRCHETCNFPEDAGSLEGLNSLLLPLQGILECCNMGSCFSLKYKNV